MELLIFGQAGRPIIFFPTRMARFYDYENWGIIDALKEKINNNELQIYCVDSIDSESFYNNEVFPSVRIARHLQYERYLLEEVIPLIYLKNNNNNIETAGCSMGAYHAINLAFKYPWLFKKTVGISGRYDLTYAPGNFRDLLNGFYNEQVYFNMPKQYISNINDEHLLGALRNMEIILAVGETDPFFEGNQLLSCILSERGIANHLFIWDHDAHKPHYWRKMVPLYI